MKILRSTWQWKGRLSIAIYIFAVLGAPENIKAHGELELRIAAATKKINTSTNNLASLYLELGELHREHQDWSSAKSDYDKAAQLDPNLALVDFCRAKLLDDSGQWEAAQPMFDKVLAHSPTNGEAFVGRARVLVKMKQHQSAIVDFRRGLELIPDPKPEYFLELAQALVAEGNIRDALITLDRGIKKFGPIVSLQGYALALELKHRNTEAALARIDTLIDAAPRKENFRAQRGDILLAAGRPVEARESFEAALASIRVLPTLLQKAPPMQNLQTSIHAALAKINSVAKVATKEPSPNAENEK